MGEHAMHYLAEKTVGRFFGVSPELIRTSFDQISEELRTQYYLGYYPQRAASEPRSFVKSGPCEGSVPGSLERVKELSTRTIARAPLTDFDLNHPVLLPERLSPAATAESVCEESFCQ